MTSNKKKFIVPELKVHGNIEQITEAGSQQNMFDIPFGQLQGTDTISAVTS